MIDLQTIQDRLQGAITATYEAEAAVRGPRSVATAVYASRRSECVRCMTFDVAWGHTKDFDTNARARMGRGDEREVDIRRRLEKAGQMSDPPFRITGSQEYFVHLGTKRLQGQKVVSGKTDGNVDFHTLSDLPEIPFDIKSWHPNMAENIKTPEDFERSVWTKAAPYQLGIYCLGKGSRYGIIFLDRPGVPRPILFDYETDEWMERLEGFLSDAEIATEAGLFLRESVSKVPDPLKITDEAMELMPPFHTNLETCLKCDWCKSVCQPPEINNPPAVPMDDELFADGKAWSRGAGFGKEAEAAKKRIRAWMIRNYEAEGQITAQIGPCFALLKSQKNGMVLKLDGAMDPEEVERLAYNKGVLAVARHITEIDNRSWEYESEPVSGWGDRALDFLKPAVAKKEEQDG